MVCCSFAALEALVFEVTNETYDDISKFLAGSFMHLTRNKISWSLNQYMSERTLREINLALQSDEISFSTNFVAFY